MTSQKSLDAMGAAVAGLSPKGLSTKTSTLTALRKLDKLVVREKWVEGSWVEVQHREDPKTKEEVPTTCYCFEGAIGEVCEADPSFLRFNDESIVLKGMVGSSVTRRVLKSLRGAMPPWYRHRPLHLINDSQGFESVKSIVTQAIKNEENKHA